MKKIEDYKTPRTNSLLAVSIYVVIAISVFVYGYLIIDFVLASKFLFLFIGLLFFTLIEYVAHRYLYHSGDDYKAEENWQYKFHGNHHVAPRDEGLLAMPIWLAILLGVITFSLFYLAIGNYAYFFWPGFFAGYAIYLFIHYKIHAQKPPNNMFRYLWKHHHLHHGRYEDKAYGVSSPLWDFIFGTMPPKKQIHDRN